AVRFGGARALGRGRGRASPGARSRQAAGCSRGDRLGAGALAPRRRGGRRRGGARDARLGGEEPRGPAARRGGARVVERLIEFGRALRAEGLPVGTGRIESFCRAAALLPLDDL